MMATEAMANSAEGQLYNEEMGEGEEEVGSNVCIGLR